MSNISDFNRIEDCNKIDAACVDAFNELTLNGSVIESRNSWGDSDVDLQPLITDHETLTTLYLSPETDPNCLVYEPERGDNICINGDDLSRIISLKKLKDVDQTVNINDGDVYMYDAEHNLFRPFNLKQFVTDTNNAIATLNATFSNINNRLTNIENTIRKPEGAPSNAHITWGNTNIYADTNAVINGSGVATSLDKSHGLYSHSLNTTAYGDNIFG